MKILLDTSAYVGFKRNVTAVVETIVGIEHQSPPMIFGLQAKQWSMEPNSSHPTNNSKKFMAWSVQSAEY